MTTRPGRTPIDLATARRARSRWWGGGWGAGLVRSGFNVWHAAGLREAPRIDDWSFMRMLKAVWAGSGLQVLSGALFP
jgi:hypothetical protein